MKRIALLLSLLLATMLAGTGSVAAGNDSSKNHADYWETNGWTCQKFPGNDAEQVKFAPFGGFTQYRLILKGGSKFNDGDGYRVIINPAFPNTWYDNPTAGTRTISHYIVCGKNRETKGPDPEMRGKAYGPKGDPWYRFTFWNTGDTSGTCFVKVNGDIIVKVRLSPEQGFRTGWRFIPGHSRVQMACWSQGEKVWGNRFRAAPPGYYGPLYRGYTRGFFPL